MAIYLEDRILRADADPRAGKLEREYAAGLAEVDKLFKKFHRKGESTSYLILARRIDEKKRVRSERTNKPKRLPPIALPVVIPYYDDELGAISIRYSANAPMPNANGGLSWPTKHIEFREFLSITENQRDLAWFLLFASSLVRKGVYKLVDKNAEYEGELSDILIQKDVIDALVADEELTRKVAQKFIAEAYGRLEGSELTVKVINWIRSNNKWTQVHADLRKNTSDTILKKERLSDIEYEGKPVTLLECPAELKMFTLKAEAQSYGIKLTVPPQSKDVLYSLIQHVKEKNTVLNE